MASVLRRTFSLRRSAAHSHSLSRRVDSGKLEREKGMIRCAITLLDENTFTCDVDKHQQGEALLDEVFSHLNVLEKDYFGLAYTDHDGVTKWVDPQKQLKKQFKGSHKLAFEFRVKFYMTDAARLQEELTQYLFYLQVKKDLVAGRLLCSFESAALLGSYIMQAELGDYDPAKHILGYVSEFRVVPVQSEDLEERIAELHKTLRGKTMAEAEFLFLSYAKRLEFYGVELYSARDHHGVQLGLGITTTGIAVFKNRTLITTFAWIHIQKITYKRKRFYIELRPDEGESLQNVVGFHMDSYEGCKQLWKNCIEYHAFFRMSEVKETPKRGILRRSKHKYLHRTELQAMEANRELARVRSATVSIQRTPSKRFNRRTPQSSRVSGDLSVASVRRTASLREDSRPKVPIRARNGGIRALSEEREIEQSYSPDLTISDDMTGQFSLVSTEDPNRLHFNFSRVTDADGPTEYYDDRNEAEELAGQVCMDDLASEGLLFIRMKSDQGKYGFNVKGGVDQKVPVIVTKVQPNSPAVECNPPVEEGDTVLYINGKSVAEKTHEEVIAMIRASKETLVIIIKPRDLSRINPTVGRETPLGITDPGHVLRESLTYLKGILTDGSGKAMLQFDRLYRRKPGMAAIASKLPQNLVKNRYRDISAYDATRVHLLEGPDYINANFLNIEIQTTGQINKYIAAQGPMQHTCKDFWQMVWEQKSTMIVMLTEVMEDGKVRCCRYWPDLHSSLEYGKYEVYTVSEQKDRICMTRQLRLKNNMSGEDRLVVHMQYIDWPDHGIPGSKGDFLRFVQGIRSSKEGMKAPMVVHCSAGIGRTGVFILMETALCKMDVLEPIYPLEIVRIMRDQRGMLVQTPHQYQFVCESILRAYEEDYVEIELPCQSVRSPIIFH